MSEIGFRGADKRDPYVLAQSAVPVCLAPNGTVATNGQITLGTALPTIYSGGIWLRLPAGAVSGGAAGLYWAVMSSTTVGQVYATFADPATQFIPSIPIGLLTNAVGSNSAYAQTTAADIALVNVNVPGGAMGPNGAFRVTDHRTFSNTAGGKTSRFRFGGTNVIGIGAATNQAASAFGGMIMNRGVLTSQVVINGGSSYLSTSAGGGGVFLSVNAAIDRFAELTANLAVATDFCIIELFCFEVLPS